MMKGYILFVYLCTVYQQFYCTSAQVAVDGGWSTWTVSGVCSVSCGGGTQTTSRSCTNPEPQYGGEQCSGSGSGTQDCSTQNCPVDGGWSMWTVSGACSVTCGGGTQTRSRSCTDPEPQNGGLQCSGSGSGIQQCNTDNCPVDGGWSMWTAWGTCSVTCAGGTQTRSRSCTNPAPQYGGAQCSGDAFGFQQCNTDNCPVNGGWTQWTAWGTCSVTCAGGTQSRSRSCTNPAPQYGGAQCSSSGSGSQQCNTDNCPVIPFGQPCKIGGDKCEGPYTECRSETCQCVSGYYWNGNNCVIKVDLGYNCSMLNACSSSRAECVGSKCRCTNPYYDTNTDNTIGGICETRRSLEASCSNSHSNSKQCVDQTASCRGSSYICSCDDRYHQDGSSCKPNIALGGNCKGVLNECSDPNAKCINSKCTCSVGFYWFNKGSSQSNCRIVQELQVTGITFSNIKITEFTVSWTASTRSSYVSGYDVELQSGGKVAGATSPQRVTGLTSGKMYVVKVISKDTATEPGVTRTTYTSKQQAAKPSIPGPVTSSENDLDASDGNIDIKWTAGTGEATLYRVKLFDGDTQKGSRDTSSFSTTFNNILNGYRYNVSIIAWSESFNGRYINSEESVSAIKTRVQVPEAPRNGVCISPTDSAITLNWTAPSLPNGDLERYHIDVMDASFKVLFRDNTTGTKTQKVVGNLNPGTSYIFRLYTENEGYISTNYDQVSSSCKTRAKMSMKPENLQITDVTSRSFLISWDKPLETYSAENYGYVLQVKDDKGACKEEVLYKCSDCKASFQVSKLSGVCDQNKQPDFTLSKAQLASQLSYNASLNPDTNYTVTVTAINNEGRGHPATMTQRTKEEAPQTPYGVKVVGMTATTFDITWNKNGPRPGQTIFVIILTADAPAESKNFTATGFALREYKAFGLQEYWNYSVAVMASTSIGSSKSAVTNEYRTSPAAPGKVSEFSIEPHPDEDFTKMKISWEMPTILERNGVIKSYRFENNEPGNVTATTNFQQNHPGYTYTKTVYVVPEEKYTFRVYAINEQNMEGEHIMVTKMAPPGVPLNIEESLSMDVIDLQREKSVTERQITITLVREFFEESTNGKVQTTGILVCVNSCDFEGVMTITDVNAMENWTEASKKGSTSYRATNSDWLDKATIQYTCGRNKREVTNIEYIVGNDDCTNVSPDEFCNGPLQPGTSYKFVAFTCTNGGCLYSRQYGPFTTANADSHCCECNTTNSQAVIVGVVLGLIIIILLLYAGYATYLIRRYRAKDEQEIKFENKKDRKSQTYVNETFMTGSASNTSGNFNVDSEVENVYSRLDDNAREDKTTYESLRP